MLYRVYTNLSYLLLSAQHTRHYQASAVKHTIVWNDHSATIFFTLAGVANRTLGCSDMSVSTD